MRFPILTTALAVLSTSSTLVAGRTYLFAFGDSYSKTLWDPTGAVPTEQNPIGNPALPGSTSAGGMNWVGFMVTKFNTTSVFLYNFARGGAVVDKTLITNPVFYPTETLDFVHQVQLFNDTLTKHPTKPTWAPWTGQNAIAAIWIGGNDIRNTWTILDMPNRHKRMITRYMEQVENLYTLGVRKFIFLTTAPTYLTPLQQKLTAAKYNRLISAVTNFNTQLLASVAAFKTSHPKATIRTVDTGPAFMTAFQNPTDFGAATATCYNSDGKTCLWFNDYHPGYYIEELVAVDVAKAWGGSFQCKEAICSNTASPTPVPTRTA
ncbi:hypothetical protein G7Z17_g9997 [Cylindrodendrum hubeiense]|uniref:Uncharacterized protein n=1 Tax=Cylindrodendrum hubeiense TaxID=595255 RepID=A0A9P5L7M3_9HYPO|nr:hypothetical protein G7Z17_g9997 [Cylindrodendrum hubeiense]